MRLPFCFLFFAFFSVSVLCAPSITRVGTSDYLNPNLVNLVSNAFIVSDSSGFFVVDTLKLWSDSAVLYNNITALTGGQPPAFVYITHGHPDHTGGIPYLRSRWPSLPVFASSAGVIRETVAWWSAACQPANRAALGFVQQQCEFDFKAAITVVTEKQLTQTGFPVTFYQHTGHTETLFSSMFMYYDAATLQTHLFTGDVVGVNSHLYVSDIFSQTSAPQVGDDDLCTWAQILQEWKCRLPANTKIYSGHGPTSEAAGITAQQVLQQNIEWMTLLRKTTANSCSPSTVWGTMVSTYPTYWGSYFPNAGALQTRVPFDAIAAGCQCNTTTLTPAVCSTPPLSPPSCNVIDNPPSCSQLTVFRPDNSCPPTFPYKCTTAFSSTVCFNTMNAAAACNGPPNSWCALTGAPTIIQNFVIQGQGISCQASQASLCPSSFPFLCSGSWGASVCFSSANFANSCNGPIGSWCAISSANPPAFITQAINQGFGSLCNAP